MTNRDFPKNTCPASRHVEMMAEILATGARYYMFEDEPEHCAESMRAVVEELWRLRTLAAQQGAREALEWIASKPDEDNEWDGRDKFRECRDHARYYLARSEQSVRTTPDV